MSEVLPPPALSAPLPEDALSLETAEEKALRKKADKLRSAWISFVGRILAQLVGAVATVLLGLYVVTTYQREKPILAATRSEVPAIPDTPIRASRPDGRSLAVLPFQDYSAGQPGEYFADGLTEALIARLAQGRQVHVTSRTSSMHFKTSREPLPTIARRLGVDYVVEGSVVRQANRARVTVQLIDARTDDHLWADTFDGRADDLLALQAEVTAAITTRLQAAMSAGQNKASGR